MEIELIKGIFSFFAAIALAFHIPRSFRTLKMYLRWRFKGLAERKPLTATAAFLVVYIVGLILLSAHCILCTLETAEVWKVYAA